MNRIVCAPMRILMCLCMCLSCFAQGALAADEIATTIRDRYASLKSFQANFTQYLTHQESGQTEKREGELLFRRPFLVSWETKPPVAERLIITDKEIWDYIADENIAYRYPRELVEDSRSLIQVVTGQALLSKDFDVKDAGTEGKLRILQLYPKEPVPQLVEARLYVDPEKGYIQRAVITDFYGNANDVRFTSFIPDADIPSRAFRFTAPKGVEVEDRIEKPAIESRDLF
ncbi:LolA family protein [Desulfovibrio sp. An276]|uniref:LolA family protein n=1 Tax=Desulfovibrio sp. An276 TaxID=1965618 RepID=UPI001EF68C3F|nr:outer membrane lipoprotein carrier protein LolA [Desulfovibrio sp. An276]